MKKFLLPIINLVNVVLVSIVFGLGTNTAYQVEKATAWQGNTDWYNLVWTPITNGRANAVGIIGFFLFVFAVAALLVAFVPTKFRKFVSLGAGAGLIAAGVLFLLSPAGGLRGGDANLTIKLSDSLIAMAVLVFIAGAFSIGMFLIETLVKDKKAEAK